MQEVHWAYSQPLSVIRLANSEECLKRIVPWDDKAGEIGQELSSKVEEDEEKVEADDTEEPVDLRNRGLLLDVVDERILRELFPKSQYSASLSQLCCSHDDSSRDEPPCRSVLC